MSKRKGKPIERAFLGVFQDVQKKLDFTALPLEELESRFLEVLIQAAISKCIEFNLVVNHKRKQTTAAFFLISNLRSICEDLIYLTYLSRMDEKHAVKLVQLRQLQDLCKGVEVQKHFFERNNPFQPVLGSDAYVKEIKQTIQQYQEDLQNFWRSEGCSRSHGPTIRDMADSVGLTSTYEFIYFSASNFVHFNPHTLLRMGWGEQKGPFVFSVDHMDGYYRSFGSFYGAILFIGFQASFGLNFLKPALDTEIKKLIELIGHVHRWPEIITFEEMNYRPPLYLITHALREVMREEDRTIPYGVILDEVLNLKKLAN